MQGKMASMMGGMQGAPGAATAMPVSDPSQLPQIGDQMAPPPGAGGQLPGSQGGKPGGGPPGAGGMGNPNSSAPQPNFAGGMPGMMGGAQTMGPDNMPPGMGGGDMSPPGGGGMMGGQGQYPGLPPGMGNRWGPPGAGAGPGIPGPYQPIDPNTMLQRRPEGFGDYLSEVAGKGAIAPHERTAQSYGESYTREPIKKKKGGK